MGVLRLTILAAWLSVAAASSQTADTRLRPVTACDDLGNFASTDLLVITSSVVLETAEVPGHCLVSGRIRPQVRFELYLPDSWNGRFYMHGNGGYAGRFPRAPGYRNRRLQKGFAVAWTDTGHNADAEPLTSFALDRQKLLDFAFRAVHVTAETAKKVIQTYYGAPHRRAYFEGCSTGGRQGLILAQRFPSDFDGIIVGAPILNETGQRMSQAWMAKALESGPFPGAKLPLLASHVYARCDDKDGLKDGLIDDPRRCDFKPSRDLPPCEGTRDDPDCFTRQQIGTLEKIYGDVMGRGKRIYPGLPVGAEIRDNWRSGWDNWIVSDPEPTIAVRFAESFFRCMAFPERDLSFDLSSFDFERDPARLNWIDRVLNATDPDLSDFTGAGGRILMFFGWADTAVNPLSGVEYYETVIERMGQSTGRFFKLFMAPGMFHCNGGVGPSVFDKLEPLMNWVEDGVAPEMIIAAQVDAQGHTVRTRPLCPYPGVARYKGSGSINEEQNFSCEKALP